MKPISHKDITHKEVVIYLLCPSRSGGSFNRPPHIMNTDLKQAIKEAGANLLIAQTYCIPVNWTLLSLMIPLQWSPLLITIVSTSVFTVIAMIRFVSLRLYFNKANA